MFKTLSTAVVLTLLVSLPVHSDGALKTYKVTLPVTGHIVVTVQGLDEEEAIDHALENEHNELTLQNVHDWKVLQHFYSINNPTPFPVDATAEEIQ